MSRFFIHLSIQNLATDISKKFGHSGDGAILFPSCGAAQQCVSFLMKAVPDLPDSAVYVIEVSANDDLTTSLKQPDLLTPTIWACIYPSEQASVAKLFWQHTGAGVSSRRAEYAQSFLDAGLLECKTKTKGASESACKGPKRYRSRSSAEGAPQLASNAELPEGLDTYVEERFGRNLNLSMASKAKSAIKKRIAGSLAGETKNQNNVDTERGFSEDDVYLYPAGMNAIYNTHRQLLLGFGQYRSICYGFPYIDTLKILEKFGPGCQFYGFSSEEELDDLEKRLKGGEKFLAMFCEFPTNPLLKTPNLPRIKQLADEFEFLVVIDETVANFLNVDVLPYADVLVSSLTKIFSGDSNVMGGS
jgi:cystathionine gamma-synthase